MDGMEEKLNSILGNPEMMRQIMSMAQAIGNAQDAPKQADPPPQKQSAPAGLMPAGLDPSMLQKLAGIAQQSGIDRNQQALLKALRPYLSHERIAKLEKAMRAAKLAGLASSFLGSSGLSFLTGR